jgi:ATP-dependent DNA helicase RecQ
MSYILEMRIDDFIRGDKDLITVTTMHKSKGREFDNVFILLPDYKCILDSEKRQLYVALTRAKSNLFVFTNTKLFQQFSSDDYHIFNDMHHYPEPDQVSIYMHHEDVYLEFSKNDGNKILIDTIHSGEPLKISPDHKFFYTSDNSRVCKMSTRGWEKLEAWSENGFKVKDAEAEYVVRWYKKEDDKSYPVVLPKVNLERKK